MSMEKWSNCGGPDNADRAEWADHALSLFCEHTGLDLEDERSEAVSDLICNLGHLWDFHGLDFIGLAERAIGVWDAEKREEQSGEADAFFSVMTVLISIVDRSN